MIVNPGSVGLAGYDGQTPVLDKVDVGTPDACHAILKRTRAGWPTAILHVLDDNAAAAEMARNKGMSVWTSARYGLDRLRGVDPLLPLLVVSLQASTAPNRQLTRGETVATTEIAASFCLTSRDEHRQSRRSAARP